MNMYDILNKFRSVADSPATAAAAEQVEKLNGVKRLDEKYMGFDKTVKSVAKNPKVKDPEAVAAAIGRKKYGKEKFQKAAAAGKKLGEASKPDFLDLDKDGDRKEPMKSAAKNPKSKKPGKEEMDEAVRGTVLGRQGYRAPQTQGERDTVAQNIKQNRAQNRADTRVSGYGSKIAPQRGVASADTGGARGSAVNVDKSGQAVDFDPGRGNIDPQAQGYRGALNLGKVSQGKGVVGEDATCMECGMYESDCGCDTNEGFMPAEEGNAFSGAVAQAKRDGIQKGEKISVGGKQYPLKEKLSAKGRKKFAALAPPKDKITFADKIAGAKKEVDEMLGDVAAEALKGAVKGVKKKVETKAGKLWPGTPEHKAKFGEPDMKRGEKKKSSSGGEIEKTAKGVKHSARDRSEEPDTDEPKSGEKRGRGRPKKYGDDKPRQERETAKSRKKDRTAHGQTGFKADKKKGKEEVDEKAVSKKQQRFMGMVHATQKGEKPASKEVAKVAKSMGKKDAKDFASTKHKGLPEKVKSKKKEESVDETTTSGSVAAAPGGKSKGGMQFGKGIYDSLNRDLEKLIAESMSINMSQSTEGGNQLTVTATEEDALKLAELLKMAGIGGAGHDDGGCGCETMEENAPDWPTNDEYSDNELQYSGGLNGPKSTGQSVGAPFNRQDQRQGAMESRLWNLYNQVKK